MFSRLVDRKNLWLPACDFLPNAKGGLFGRPVFQLS
jgi:hypothetical protein